MADIIPRLAFNLGGDTVSRLKILFLLYFVAVGNKVLNYHPTVCLPLCYNGEDIPMYISHTSHIASLKEIFLDAEYVWCPILEPKFIFDLGAHIGDSALYYHARFPKATIVAVEPSPNNFELLKKNCEHITNIKLVQAAVSESNGVVELHIGSSSLGYSVNKRSDTKKTVTVPTVTLDSLMNSFSVKKADLIKFDIEGGEERIFSAQHPPHVYSSSYIGEVHTDLMSLTGQQFISLFKKFEVDSLEVLSDHRFILKVQSNVE